MHLPHEYQRFAQIALPPDEQWVCTLSGRKFYPLAVGCGQIEIEDIAQGISRRYRFGGQAPIDYTVAQHSVEVSRAVESLGVETALWGLLHDAAEAYLPDWQRPVKRAQAWYDVESNQFMEFGVIELSILISVARRFHLAEIHIPQAVHTADFEQLQRERRDLFDDRQPRWENLSGESDLPAIELPTWSPAQAKSEFLARFEQLMASRDRLLTAHEPLPTAH